MSEFVIQVRLAEDEIPRDIERIRRQIDAGLAPDRRHSTNETKERAHQNRLEAIQRQSAAAIQQIETRKQAQLEVIRERAVQKEIEQQRRLERAAQSGTGSFQAFLRRFSSTIREAGESIQQAGVATLGLTNLIVGLGRSSVQSALDIDRQVNVLKALTGSAEAAERRFAQLVATAQRTPGLTTSLAATLDAQLRTLSVSEQTINRVLPAIGRLNAVSPLGDPQRFAQNLVQLVTQNFEKQDLKELVGQSPLAGELIRQIFNVDSPTNAKAIRDAAKRLGITTVEGFFTEFAQAAANNPKLQAITESLATQFEKLRDRIIVALRPLGLALIQTLQPLVETAVPIIERISKAFAELPAGVRQLIVLFGGLAVAIGPVLIAAGALTQSFGAIGNLITALAGAGGIAALSTVIVPLIPVVAALAAGVIALGAAFATNFGGIRDVTADVIDFVRARFVDAGRAFEDNRTSLDKLRVEFGRLSTEVRPILKLLGELFKEVFEKTLKGALLAAQGALVAFNHVVQRVIDGFQTLKTIVRETSSAAASFLGSVASPLTGGVLGRFIRELQTPRPRGTGEGLDGEEITQADFSRAFEAQRRAAEEAKKQRDAAATAAATARSVGPRSAADAKTPVDLLFFAQSRELDLAAQQQAIDSNFDELGRAELQRQKGEAQAFGGIVKAIQENKTKLARDAEAAQAKFNQELQKTVEIAQEFDPAFRFMRGLRGETDAVAASFDRLGQNIGNAFGDVKNLLSSLASAVKQFFGEILTATLRTAAASALAPLFGAGGGLGNLFRTPSFAQAFAGAGDGISAPPSITATQQIASLFNFGNPFAPRQNPTGIFANGAFGAGLAGGSRFSLSGLLGGLAGAAPLLGLGLGAGFGGQSVAGQILGAVGGGAVGLGASFGSAVFGAGGGLGQAALAALGPIALIGAPLLVGSILLGKAKQRRQDEEASGQMLTQALQGIDQLAAAVSAGQLTSLAEARGVFENQILATFRQQINTLKTKSVRESRLTNQVRDLRNVFEARIPPLIAEQEGKASDARRFAAIDARLIPQFASGGTTLGGLAFLHDGEKILNLTQQARVRAMAGPDVFERAGVPGPNQNRIFDVGGTFGGSSLSPSRSQGDGTIVIDRLVISIDAEDIAITGMSGRNGEQVVINHIENVNLRKGRR